MSYTAIEKCFSVYHGRSKFWKLLLENPNINNALSGAWKHLARVDYFPVWKDGGGNHIDFLSWNLGLRESSSSEQIRKPLFQKV